MGAPSASSMAPFHPRQVWRRRDYRSAASLCFLSLPSSARRRPGHSGVLALVPSPTLEAAFLAEIPDSRSPPVPATELGQSNHEGIFRKFLEIDNIA